MGPAPAFAAAASCGRWLAEVAGGTGEEPKGGGRGEGHGLRELKERLLYKLDGRCALGCKNKGKEREISFAVVLLFFLAYRLLFLAFLTGGAVSLLLLCAIRLYTDPLLLKQPPFYVTVVCSCSIISSTWHISSSFSL